MIIKRLLERKKLVLFCSITYTLLLTLLCLKTPSKNIEFVSQSDKIYHALAYFIFTIAWFITFSSLLKVKRIHNYIIVFFTSLVYGIIIELAQHYLTIDRQGDYKDVFANILGTLIALVILKILNNKTVKS